MTNAKEVQMGFRTQGFFMLNNFYDLNAGTQ